MTSSRRVFSPFEIAALVIAATIALTMAVPLQAGQDGADVILPLGTPSVQFTQAEPPSTWKGGSSDEIFGRGSSAFGAVSTDGTLVLPSAGHMTLDYALTYALAECKQKSDKPQDCRVFLTLLPEAFPTAELSSEVAVLDKNRIGLIRDLSAGKLGGQSPYVFYASSLGAGFGAWSGDGKIATAHSMASKECHDRQAELVRYLPPWVPVSPCEPVWAGGPVP